MDAAFRLLNLPVKPRHAMSWIVPAGTLDSFCTHIHLLAQQFFIAFEL